MCLPCAYPAQKRAAVPSIRLTKLIVEKLQPEGTETIYWDDTLPGFGVRVKTSGSRSYLVQYRNRETGRSCRMTIGPHGPLLSFQQARDRARGILADALRGADPAAERTGRRRAPDLAALCDANLRDHAETKKRSSSTKADRAYINRFILPALGPRKVGGVSLNDIQKLHNGLAATPYQANRVLALLSKMFALAIRWSWRTDNPAKGVEKYHEDKRTRWLSDEELRRLTEAVDAHSNQIAANAIRLQLLTGARIGEVLTATWGDFDLARGVWTKPSHHTKQKRTEHLPLSMAAIDLLSRMRDRSSGKHLFPGRTPDRPLTELKRFWSQVCEAAELRDYRIHDNRHTHASHLVSSGLSLTIVGRLLGHTNPTTTQRYAHLADTPLREAAEVMARKLKG
jgi:integrase